VIEANLRKIVSEYPDLVKTIEQLEITEEGYISKLKAKLRFFDGTILWVREVWQKEVIIAYSYYWLRPDETVIIGWDNAPHHREVKSFPHHKHIGGRIEESHENSLTDAFNYIKSFLESL
jgi:hypothetical protein